MIMRMIVMRMAVRVAVVVMGMRGVGHILVGSHFGYIE